MKLRSRVLFICSISTFIFANIAHAFSCVDVTNQIHSDIAKYSDNVQSKHLPWMQLSWLKNQLGTAEKDVLTADEIQYSWKCPDDDNNYLSVIRNKQGELTKFSGQYSSEEGSGSFSLDKKVFAEIAPPKNTKRLKQAALSSKYDLVKQISNDFEEYA